MSAEPGRTAPYASDLRWRVVWQHIALGLSFTKIATNLSISVGTAHNIFQRFQASGGVDPKHVCTQDNLRKLDNHHRLYIIGLILDSPDLTLTEVVLKCKRLQDFTVHVSTICRILAQHGLTRKKSATHCPSEITGTQVCIPGQHVYLPRTNVCLD